MVSWLWSKIDDPDYEKKTFHVKNSYFLTFFLFEFELIPMSFQE